MLSEDRDLKKYNSSLPFTGERIIPGKVSKYHFYEAFCRYEFVKHYVKDKIVLDAGCGQGYGAFFLSNNAKSVVGIDIAHEAINDAKKNYIQPNLCFKIMDITKMEFPNNFFDVICSFEAIEHLDDHGLFLTEVARVLKPSGHFFISTPNGEVFGRGELWCHKKEFILEEVRSILNSYFDEIELFGQHALNKAMLLYRNSLIRRINKIKARFGVVHLLPIRWKYILERLFTGHSSEHATCSDFIISKKNVRQGVYFFTICQKPKLYL
ncbi:class I SAM-dependent methyltransferase [Candidatus Aerophobetes bacterium]|nr:class I SAM-dependent methyltransferase [Candidatus Aerophobetes bacterium]